MDYTISSGYVTNSAGQRQYADRNDATGVQGTYLTAADQNAVQNEIVYTITYFGFTPNAADTTQLAQAIAAGIAVETLRATTVESNLQTSKAPLASPAFTGTPTVPTAPVRTNTTQAASMSAVLRQAGNYAGFYGYTSDVTLTASQVGGAVQAYGASNFTITLPLSNTTEAGDTFTFYAALASGTEVTIGVVEPDFINMSGSGSVSSITLKDGDSATLVSRGSNEWDVSGGSISTHGRLLNIATFTSSGTYTPTPGMRSVVVEVQGAGGGSGGIAATSSTEWAMSGGGESGAYAKSYFTAATIGSSQVVTIASGGAGGSSGNNGTTAGYSTFGSLMAAGGGDGSGVAGPASYEVYFQIGGGATGSVATAGGGNILNVSGSPGQPSMATTTGSSIRVVGGSGGGSIMAGGSPGPGSGGGGAAQTNGAGTSGNPGQNGQVIIYEYS
jgi:hypothetical protein